MPPESQSGPVRSYPPAIVNNLSQGIRNPKLNLGESRPAKVVDMSIISVSERISNGAEVNVSGSWCLFLTCTPHVEARGGPPK